MRRQMPGDLEMSNSFKCCLCGRSQRGYGNNAEPLNSDGRCCDKCNEKVVQARMNQMIQFEPNLLEGEHLR